MCHCIKTKVRKGVSGNKKSRGKREHVINKAGKDMQHGQVLCSRKGGGKRRGEGSWGGHVGPTEELGLSYRDVKATEELRVRYGK
jgi:hypothetical protein